MPKFRVRMRKTGRYAFMSHLDMMRALERAIRRSGLRLAFSEGFHPHPKISFAAPLSVGISSEGEIADIELMSSAAADEVSAKLAAHLPEGLRVDRVVEVTSDGRSLMSRVAAATYRIRIPVDLLGDRPLDEQVQRMLERDSLTISRERKGNREVVDVRPLILGLEVARSDSRHAEIEARLATGSKGNLRPTDLIAVFRECGILAREPRGVTVHRVEILAKQNGSMVPLI
jgi:radical SAM-linked protein